MKAIISKMLAKEEEDRYTVTEILEMPEYQRILYGNYFDFIHNSNLNEKTQKGMTKMMKQLFNPTLINEILLDF